MANSDIYNLEYLSLVAKITQELDNHTGLNDKTLAEFVISLHDESKTLPEFKKRLKDCGADFPETFVENVDRLILNMHPKHKKKYSTPSNGDQNMDTDGNNSISETDKKKRLFPGLALKDQEPIISKDVLMKEVDDLMAQFEGASKKSKTRPAENERLPKRQRRDRSRSPSRRRSPSPSRGRGYGDRRDGRGGGRSHMDEKPVLYKIYSGKVSGMKDFGVFVTLEGVAGRAEGTCIFDLHHTTNLNPLFRYGTHIKHTTRCSSQQCS